MEFFREKPEGRKSGSKKCGCLLNGSMVTLWTKNGHFVDKKWSLCGQQLSRGQRLIGQKWSESED